MEPKWVLNCVGLGSGTSLSAGSVSAGSPYDIRFKPRPISARHISIDLFTFAAVVKQTGAPGEGAGMAGNITRNTVQ